MGGKVIPTDSDAKDAGERFYVSNFLCSPNQANGAKFSTLVTLNAYVHALSHTPIKCESYLDAKSMIGFGFPSA